MATARKIKAGWASVEEAPTPATVAETSVAEPPERLASSLGLTWSTIRDAYDELAPAWQSAGLSHEQCVSVLQTLLGKKQLSITTAQAFVVEMYKPAPGGWTLAGFYRELAAAATKWLLDNGGSVPPAVTQQISNSRKLAATLFDEE